MWYEDEIMILSIIIVTALLTFVQLSTYPFYCIFSFIILQSLQTVRSPIHAYIHLSKKAF